MYHTFKKHEQTRSGTWKLPRPRKLIKPFFCVFSALLLLHAASFAEPTQRNLSEKVLKPVDKLLKPKMDIQFFGDFYIPWHILKKTNSSIARPRIFSKVRAIFAKSDNNVINFEGVATGVFSGGSVEKKYRLRMPLWAPKFLPALNVRMVTLGNNHSLDFGYQGLFDTLARLEGERVQAVGAGRNLETALRPGVLRIRGQSVCVQSFNRTLPVEFWADRDREGTAYLNFTDTARQVRALSHICDLVIPVFHWGAEKSLKPKPYQIRLAELVIDNGAAAVIGHHPHVIQTITSYKGRPVLYSLGNSIFGTRPLTGTATGIAVGLNFASGKIRSMVVTALEVENKKVDFVPSISSAARDMRHHFSKPLLNLCESARVSFSQTVCDLSRSKYYNRM